ncbi:hypothetical protein [Clostridium tagluense]|uniref:hypothetical protein n=1 Tax=Clostridium tagluense TaxID=360422 RepID=UPI001CF1883E|nr:hypothetical protein [Clostridium tagluense]MCB2300418.1 hypothetical protein [Clostridium tagluense]
MDLRIKQMEICKNLRDLKSWIINDLKETEVISFFIEEDCEEETKLSVKKEKLNYIVTLGDEEMSRQHDFELFDGFLQMCEVETLQEILVFKISLNEVA